jgi:hypothetical protein
MPSCFQLRRKEQYRPAALRTIDDELWLNVAGQEPHPKLWCADWYNSTGLRLAMGRTFKEILQEYKGQLELCRDDEEGVSYWSAQIEVAEYLAEHFTPKAWHEHKV